MRRRLFDALWLSVLLANLYHQVVTAVRYLEARVQWRYRRPPDVAAIIRETAGRP